MLLLLACMPEPSAETVDHVVYLQALGTREPMVAALRCDDIGSAPLRGECRYFAALEAPPDEGRLICQDSAAPWDALCAAALESDVARPGSTGGP